MTISEAIAHVQSEVRAKIDVALNAEVADAVKEEEANTTISVVYGVYTPKVYRRRGDFGGIADIYNMDHTVSGGVLKVVNATEANDYDAFGSGKVTTGKDLPLLIERGHGNGGFYDFPRRGRAYMGPRPFTATTIKNLAGNKAHVDALKAGLKRQGLKVK